MKFKYGKDADNKKMLCKRFAVCIAFFVFSEISISNSYKKVTQVIKKCVLVDVKKIRTMIGTESKAAL